MKADTVEIKRDLLTAVMMVVWSIAILFCLVSFVTIYWMDQFSPCGNRFH